MSVAELIPTLKTLTPDDMRQVIRILQQELKEESIAALEPGATYPIWSPYDAYEAAETLEQMLIAHRESG